MGEEVKLRFLTLNRTLLSHNNYFSLKLTFKRGPLTYTACNLSEKLLLCLCLSILRLCNLDSVDFLQMIYASGWLRVNKDLFSIMFHKSLHCYKWDTAAFCRARTSSKLTFTAGNEIYFPCLAKNSREILTLITGYWADKSP